MTESTARVERFESKSSAASAAPFYLWEVAQKPVCVRIPFPVIDRLEHEAVENFRSLDSRGSEIGGVLFGSVTPGDPSTVFIEDYELISCDYSRGPLYRLSDADLGRFDRIISQHGSSGSITVAGFFRSHTRKGLALDAEDMVVFETRFKDPRNIALLVRPFATKASTAGIFIWEDGSVHVESSHLEFPFRSSLLTASTKPLPSAPEAPSAPAPGNPLPPPAAPRPTTRAQIVPIASRREVSSPSPSLTLETPSPVVVPIEAPPSTPAPVPPAPVSETPAPAVPPAPVAAAPVAPPAPTPVAPEKPAPVATPAAPPTPTAKPVIPTPAPTPTPTARPATPAPVATPVAPPATPRVTPPAPKVETRIEPKAEPKVDTKVEEEVLEESGMSPKIIKVAGGVAVMLALLVALFLYPGFLRHKPSVAVTKQDSSALALHVERTGNELKLTWNNDSDAIRNATHAVLAISDGDQRENVDMDLTLLHNGSISYFPVTSDVAFQMEVTGKSGSRIASESVRVLQTRPSPMPDAGQTSAGAGTPNNPAQTKPNTPANGKPGDSASLPTAADNSAASEAAAPVTPVRPLKQFHAENLSQRLHPTTSAEIPDAPSVGRAESTPSGGLSGLNLGSSAPPMPPPPAPVAAAPKNNPPAPEKKALQTGGQIQEAVLIRKKLPEYPKLARETGAKGSVELTATIGPDGHVKSVKVVRGHPMLVKAASDAVMQWLYKPTMLNGVPVETTTQVVVNFQGDQR